MVRYSFPVGLFHSQLHAGFDPGARTHHAHKPRLHWLQAKQKTMSASVRPLMGANQWTERSADGSRIGSWFEDFRARCPEGATA